MPGKRSLRQDQSPRLGLPPPFADGASLVRHHGQNGEHRVSLRALVAAFLVHLLVRYLLEFPAEMPRSKRKVRSLTRTLKKVAELEPMRLPELLPADVE